MGTAAVRGQRLRELDWLMATVVVLCCLGLVMAVSIEGVRGGPLPAMRGHGIKLLSGVVAFLIAAVVPVRALQRRAWPLFLVATGLCLAAALLFRDINGASRWIRIGGFGFQPVELARVALVVLCARLLGSAGAVPHGLRSGFLPTMGVAALLAGVLLLQPDLGNAILCVAIAGSMALVRGVRMRYFMIAAAPALAGFLLLAGDRAYVQQRIAGFLDPEPASQVGQSLTAIASGGLTGQGLGGGWMKMGFVPEAGNDFVFAILGEELGLLGSVAVVALYAVFGAACLRLVLSMRDPFLRMLAFGLSFALCLQASINLLVVTGLAPAKGIDLPFVSSGGTNLTCSLAAVGIIGNAARTDAASAGEGSFFNRRHR
jgi:cell division protein FtsW